MITPEFSRWHNCPACGWRDCGGCYDPPEEEPDDGPPVGPDPAAEYDDEPEALGWTPVAPHALYPVPATTASVAGR